MKKDASKLGYCGYDCSYCGARSENPAVRKELVDAWKKYFGLTMYTVENVKCAGCRNEGKVADKHCKARPCARKKGVESCAFCEEFPCKKLKPVLNPIFFISEKEYDFCMRQFDSRKYLTPILVDQGRPPFWTKKKYK